MEDLAKHLRVVDMQDWYRVTEDDVLNYGGQGLMEQYQGSLRAALKALYQFVPQWTDLHPQLPFL